MKHKIIIKLLLLIVLFSNIQLSFSQSSNDLMTYWYYRNRLSYFVVPGNKIGESQIVCTRNRIDNANDAGKKDIDYGQIGMHDGLYIGVLATEYYLLKQNGQDTDAAHTLNELYYSLNCVKVYWDTYAEPYWNKPASYNGFFMRGNVPCGFLNTTNTSGNGFAANGKSHLSILNKGLKTTDTYNDPPAYNFGSFPRGHAGYINYYTDSTYSNHVQAMSEDEAIIIMLGCSLAAKLAVGTTSQTLAKDMVDKIVSYVINKNQIYGDNFFRIYNPDGTKVIQKYGGCSMELGPGIQQAGSQITGNSYSIPVLLFPWVKRLAQQVAWGEIKDCGTGDADLTASLLAMGNYKSGEINHITVHNNWDTFYLLLWEVLNNNTRTKNHQIHLLKKAKDQLDDAPCEGPYCYLQDTRVYEYNYYFWGKMRHKILLGYLNNGVFAGNGWATDYKWFKHEDQQDYGQDAATGNFNGCDYMLLYNLRHIITKDTATYYVDYMHRNLIGTVNSPANFIGYSTIVSTQLVNSATPIVNYKAGDSIHLKTGFHAVHGSNFHAYIGTVDCSDAESHTPYYDSLISVHQDPYNATENDDTIIDNNIYITLPCPIINDTLNFAGVFCDTIDTINAYHWDFGNGQISTLQEPKILYNTPGTYTITVIRTDTNSNTIITDTTISLVDTIKIIVTVPDCKIYGYLNENPSCGGNPIIGDSLYITYNGVHVASVSPAGTQANGSFTFNGTQIDQLDTNKLYSITSQNGTPITGGMTPQSIRQWELQSALNLSYSTTVKQEWVERYNGAASLSDMAYAVDLMGNVYVTGNTSSTATTSDIITIKYDPSGTQLWAKTYSGSGSYCLSAAKAIKVDASGNVYITGQNCVSNESEIPVISYNSNGTFIGGFVYSYSSTYNVDIGNSIIQDHAGNFIIGGCASSANTVNSITTLIKINNNENYLWSAQYTSPATNPHDSLTAISVDTINNIYATGCSAGVSTGNDILTIKYNSTGNQYWGIQLWADRYNNPDNGNDYSYSNTVDNNGDIIVTGYSHRSSGKDEIVVISYSTSGTRNWVKIYNADTHDYAYKVLCDNANNIYICGYTGNASSSGLLALKYNMNGTLLWSKYSLTTNKFIFKSAALDGVGDLYITGTTMNSNGYTDITTQKIDGSGNIQWTMTYNGPANNIDAPANIMVSENGNVYVCGESSGNGTGYDFTTIKYSQCLSTASLLKTNNSNDNISQSAVNTATGNISLQVIPNPNNGNMQVTYEVPANTSGTFEVYNLIGSKLFSYPLTGGKNTFSISRTDLNAGIYFYRAIAGNKLIATDKIVVIK